MTDEQLARLQELYDQTSWTGAELREIGNLMRKFYPYAIDRIHDLEDNEIVLCQDIRIARHKGAQDMIDVVDEIETIDF